MLAPREQVPPEAAAAGGDGRDCVWVSPASQVEEELSATRLFENPIRRDLGLPPRTSYFKEGESFRSWRQA